MKIFTMLSAFVLISINVAMADDIKHDTLPPCEGQGCSAIAVKVVLEEKNETRDLKIRIGSMAVSIPSNVTRIDLAKSLTVFRYETAPHITLSTETYETFRNDKLTSKPISISEAMVIIFTKTLKDSDITSKYDKELLNNLMWIKKGFMEGAKEAFVYDKGSVKIYYLPNGAPPSRNLAWAIDSEHPNVAIRLESDLSQNSFIKILYSISSIKRKGK
jgi:hypothetical protein